MIATTAVSPLAASAPAARAATVASHGPHAAASPRVCFSELLRAHATPDGAAAPRRPAPDLTALGDLERVRGRLDEALAQARAGRAFSAQELLALQSDAYRYQARVEVASKLVESAAHTVRQAVNTQV